MFVWKVQKYVPYKNKQMCADFEINGTCSKYKWNEKLGKQDI